VAEDELQHPEPDDLVDERRRSRQEEAEEEDERGGPELPAVAFRGRGPIKALSASPSSFNVYLSSTPGDDWRQFRSPIR
jgi:hypothetical protein